MGASVQWRGENSREPSSYGKTITFGNLRDKGTAYMSYSERVGPGVVVLGGSNELCDWLTEEGFTALAPLLPDDAATCDRIVDAAVDHLVDNWHPRVGVLAVGSSRPIGQRLIERRNLDGAAFLESENDADDELVDDFRYDLS
jgi:hypothetical protein